MTSEDIIRAARECARLLEANTCRDLEPAELKDKSILYFEQPHDSADFDAHVLWACGRIVALAEEGTAEGLEKANWWLGWVQGYMVRDGICLIDDQRAMNQHTPKRDVPVPWEENLDDNFRPFMSAKRHPAA
jgi:hypothetical protein